MKDSADLTGARRVIDGEDYSVADDAEETKDSLEDDDDYDYNIPDKYNLDDYDDEDSEEEEPYDIENDDDFILDNPGDDVILSDKDMAVLVKQMNGTASWEILGLYNDEGKVRSKRSLSNDPPVFVVSSSNGDSCEFLLTKDLSGILAERFKDLHNAFYGITPRSERTVRESLNDVNAGLKANIGKFIVCVTIIIVFLIIGSMF